jgi:hypothetical protein
MSRVAVILQPSYLPWIGHFDLMSQADVWVWYDDVQYTKRDWRNRNRVAADGEPLWLTVPVKSRGRFEQPIHEVEIDRQRPWSRKHLETIRRLYRRAPYLGELVSLLEGHYAREPRHLADLVIDLNEALCRALGLEVRFVRSSTLDGIAGRKQERLIAVCRQLDADVYLSGPAARAYIDPDGFGAAAIELRYVVYNYPPYERGGQPFVPQLSIVDAFCWLGPRAVAAYVRENSRWQSPGAAARKSGRESSAGRDPKRTPQINSS